jgi:hypothetical protein
MDHLEKSLWKVGCDERYMLEVELNTLDPKSFDNIHDFFTKFKYFILSLEYCGIDKYTQVDQLILKILAKLGP